MGQTHCQTGKGEQMQRRDQSQCIDMQCTAESSLSSLKGRWWNGCLFFDQSGHYHSNLPWRGELASPRLAYLTLPIPSLLIYFVELRNDLLKETSIPAKAHNPLHIPLQSNPILSTV